MFQEDLAVIRRWHQATAETQKLLREADVLIEERVELFRARAVLFRDFAREASSFLDAAAQER